MNEANVDLRWGVASVNIFLASSLICYLFGVRKWYVTAIEANEQEPEDRGIDPSPEERVETADTS